MRDHTRWMQKAIALAKKAESKGEVPIGAVIVLDNEIIGSGYNSPIAKHDPTAHAEIMALRSAARKIKNYRILGAVLYVTLEPCPMCISAMTHARIKSCVYGAEDPKKKLNIINHNINFTGNILGLESGNILKNFFRKKRL